MSFNLRLNGDRLAGLYLVLPWRGVGTATLRVAGERAYAGTVVLSVGDVEIRCFVESSEVFALETHVRVIFGSGGWRRIVAPRGHHNDAQVRAADVASVLAAEVGETIEVDPAYSLPLGVDWAVPAGPAHRALDLVFAQRVWWVGLDGITYARPRPTTDVTGRLRVVSVDPRRGIADCSADDLSLLLPGSTFTDRRLGGTFLIREAEVWSEGTTLRARAWGGADFDNELGTLLGELVLDALSRLSFPAGPYRYRVVEQVVDRVNLQPVNPLLGLPDVGPIGMAPGLGGASARPALGSIVYVDFVEGDPGMPLVRSFARADDAGHVPLELAIDAEGALTLGASSSMVAIGSGSEALAVADPSIVGRPIRYGDTVLAPTFAQLNTAFTLLPPPAGVVSVAKVRAGP